MAKICVAGGLGETTDEARRTFAAALGRNIIGRGHILLGGCRTSLDAEVAEAANTAAIKEGLHPKDVIRSWITGNTTKPAHAYGTRTHSLVAHWNEVPRSYNFPEPIEKCDVVIIVGGWEGTHYAASWARIVGKPLLPVATFDDAARDIFNEERKMLDRRAVSRISPDDFQMLDQILPDKTDATLDAYAVEILKLAERTILSSDVFVVMSFAKDPALDDVYDTITRACKEKGFTAKKVDEHLDPNRRIIPAIFERIKRSAFVIADITDPRPNVYYELGYANALNKVVIQTAREGTTLHFDVFDVPTLYWSSQRDLEGKLKNAIDQLKQSPGQYS